jgi:hypothetical protein
LSFWGLCSHHVARLLVAWLATFTVSMFVIEIAVGSDIHMYATFAIVVPLLYRVQYKTCSGEKYIAVFQALLKKIAYTMGEN